MNRFMLLCLLLLGAMSLSGLEILEEETWDIGPIAFPVSVSSGPAAVLVAVGEQVYSVDEQSVVIQNHVPVPEGHVILDVAQAIGRTAYLSGNVGFNSELRMYQSSDQVLIYGPDRSAPDSDRVIRKIELLDEDRLLVEEAVPPTMSKPQGSVRIVVLRGNESDENVLFEARELNLLAASRNADTMIVDVFDQDMQPRIALVREGTVHQTIDVDYLSHAEFLASECEFIGVSLTGLVHATVSDESVSISPIDSAMKNVLGLDYSSYRNALFVVHSEAPGRVSLTRFRIVH